MKKQAYFPKAASIFGTTHFPEIDNQGAIGSCASQSITRNQFSNAVSRYKHAQTVGCQYAPRDNKTDCFTPKFSYSLVGPGTKWVYELIMENGALPEADCTFSKNEHGGHIFKDQDGKLCTQTTSLPVKEGQMERAMENRIGGYEQIWFTHEPYLERLTTCEAGLKMIEKIKAAIVRGDAVVTGGYPSRWVFSKLDGCGTIGKVGDGAVVAAAGNAGGGHQVTIVGYDDDVTATFAGVKLKGAFLIANSYGKGWQNNGLCFMMYDACNTVSAYPELNNSALYSGPMYLTPKQGMGMFPESLAMHPQSLTMTPAGECRLYGKNYPCFTAKDQSGQYLCFSSEKNSNELLLGEEGCRFAFIPYNEIMETEAADKQWYKEEFEGSYWIYAPDKDTNQNGSGMVDAGTGFASSGRKVHFATLNAGRYPEAKSWILDCKPEGCFTSRFAIAAGKGISSERIWTVDQFCFIDYRKDIVLGMPKMYAKVSVCANNRDCFKIYLTRKEKGARAATRYLPAIYKYQEFHPTFVNKEKGEYLNFDGVMNGPESTAHLAFNFEPLLKLPKGKTVADYEWGIQLKKARKGKAKLLEATLMNGDKTPLATADIQKNCAVFRLATE